MEILQRQRTVDFLIAGVQKGATTALHHFLRQHDNLHLPDRKELHFFDDTKLDWTKPDYDRSYHSHFCQVPPEDLWGESTPIYTYWKPSAARLHAYNRHIKLIVSLRDPVARAYSHWRMEVARNAEPLSFSTAIREGRDRVKREAEIPDQHRVFSYVERGFYADQIRRLLSLFPREQLYFLTPKDLSQHQKKTLDGICDFLGVPGFSKYPENEFVFSHKNADVEGIATSDIDYLRSLYREDIKQTEDLVGRKIPQEFH